MSRLRLALYDAPAAPLRALPQTALGEPHRTCRCPVAGGPPADFRRVCVCLEFLKTPHEEFD